MKIFLDIQLILFLGITWYNAQTTTIYPIKSSIGKHNYLTLVGNPTQSLNKTTRYYNQINGASRCLSVSTAYVYGENVISTTYEYKTLVGVTKITDPKGHTITYHYDSFNRLKS